MLDYGARADEETGRRTPDAPAGPARALDIAEIFAALARNKLLIAATILATLVAVFIVAKSLTPRYVATAEIYMDPRSLQELGSAATPAEEDSTGYINLVESQLEIITSQLVLDRVVRSEHLTTDPEFVGPPPSGLGALLNSALHTPPVDPGSLAAAAARALAARISVNRPERTFVIYVSVTSRDPDKAARLANAVANAYIAVQSSLQSNMARETNTSLTGTLASMRARVLADDRAVEDFKAAHNLYDTKDGLLTDQQLSGLSQQLATAHSRTEDARARYGEVQKALATPGDLGAIGESINSSALATLRSQQTDAQQQLADLAVDLGPLHPALRDAQARVAAVDQAIDAELGRIADATRTELAQDEAAEAAAARDLDKAKQTTDESDQNSVELSQLQREADASATLYTSFLDSSQENGAIENVAAPSVSITSSAVAPVARTFPPSTAILMLAGLVLGSLLGAALALAREFVWGELAAPRPDTVPARTPGVAPSQKAGLLQRLARFGQPRSAPDRTPPVVDITSASRLLTLTAPQNAARIDLASLGIAALQHDSDTSEFAAVLALIAPPRESEMPARESKIPGHETATPPGKRRCVGVLGDNANATRSLVAINLALAAARLSVDLMLLDADETSYHLTRAVESALSQHGRGRSAALDGIFYRTTAGPILVLPASDDAALGGLSTAQMLDSLRHPDMPAADLVVCDGPDMEVDSSAPETLRWIDDILVVGDAAKAPDPAEWRRSLGTHADKLRCFVHVHEDSVRQQVTARRIA